MSTASSGMKLTDVRISNFRALKNIEVELDDLTVLIGSNNAGKTSFLDALFAAIGAGRKLLGQDDVRLEPGEAFPPKERQVVIDLRIRPLQDDGSIAEVFPEGSFWTGLWGSGISQDASADFVEFVGLRTTLLWSPSRGDYVVERKFLKEWLPYSDWLSAETQDQRVSANQVEPIALHYIDAKRDLEDDLRRQGSFWRRMTEDLGLDEAEVQAFESVLTDLNSEIVEKSEILKHLKTNLSGIREVVAADGATIDIAPVARKLRDLSKGVDVNLSTAGAQSFPLARHGMGTRSLASLLVFRAFASWRSQQATKEGDHIHALLALEEPESHLHPQAQRSLFAHVKSIPGQRIVSTHSPYFAGQAGLADLRLFFKNDGETKVCKLDLSALGPDDLRKLQNTVVNTRGDLLFATAVVFFEGETEEQALPIIANCYWNSSIHDLGFSFVRVGGASNYFPFIWLAENLNIPWYVFADGEAQPVKQLESALKRAAKPPSQECPNVIVLPNDNDFEKQMIEDGYLPQIEAAIVEAYGSDDYLDSYIKKFHGAPAKKGGTKDYSGDEGRSLAALDVMKGAKTKLAEPLARALCSLGDEGRRFPPNIRALFEAMSDRHHLPKSGVDE